MHSKRVLKDFGLSESKINAAIIGDFDSFITILGMFGSVETKIAEEITRAVKKLEDLLWSHYPR